MASKAQFCLILFAKHLVVLGLLISFQLDHLLVVNLRELASTILKVIESVSPDLFALRRILRKSWVGQHQLML